MAEIDRTTTRRGDEDGLGWLVDDFVGRTPGATHALVVTADGLVLTFSKATPEDSVDQMAAITSGLASLADGAASCIHTGEVRQVIIEMDDSYLFLSRVGDGSALALVCEATCDIGLIGYEMSLLIARIGDALTPELRSQDPPPIGRPPDPPPSGLAPRRPR